MKIMKRGIIYIVFFMLLTTSSSVPLSATTISEKVSQFLTKGDILYVGGSGPNNYTRIQDAVDAASEGDTVFVYDDSSPYKENITICKPLMIQGEDKQSTIIDGSSGKGYSFHIKTNHTTITRFTLQNSGVGVYIGGPWETASHNTITETIILNTTVGIAIYYGDPQLPDFLPYGYNTISDNYIKNTTEDGIAVHQGQYNLITRNTITENHGRPEYDRHGFAISLSGGAFNNISYNTVSKNTDYGIIIGDTYNTLIYRNTIEQNGLYGLAISSGSFDHIIQNNFMGNRRDAVYDQEISILTNTLLGHYPLRPCIWKENYWNRPRVLPHIIPGWIGYGGYFSWSFYGLFDMIPPNSMRLDWRPAQAPYKRAEL